jgi:hypothetical protein
VSSIYKAQQRANTPAAASYSESHEKHRCQIEGFKEAFMSENHIMIDYKEKFRGFELVNLIGYGYLDCKGEYSSDGDNPIRNKLVDSFCDAGLDLFDLFDNSEIYQDGNKIAKLSKNLYSIEFISHLRARGKIDSISLTLYSDLLFIFDELRKNNSIISDNDVDMYSNLIEYFEDKFDQEFFSRYEIKRWLLSNNLNSKYDFGELLEDEYADLYSDSISPTYSTVTDEVTVKASGSTREKNNTMALIGILVAILTKETKRERVFDTQAELINFLEKYQVDQEGLSKSNLEKKFAAAKRAWEKIKK